MRTDEHAKYIAFVRRIVRAAGKRVGRLDPEDLAQLVGLRDDLDDAIRRAVDGLRADGFTWQSIGDALGVTRQAALMRWGNRSTQKGA